MAGVFILIIVYVALLIHLKPSLRNKKPSEADLDFKISQQRNPEKHSIGTSLQPITPIETEEFTREPPTSLDAPAKSKAEIQTPKELTPPSPKELLPHRAKELPRKSGPPGCRYHFGYLGELPENTPIPDECLGCLKLMECLIRRSTTI